MRSTLKYLLLFAGAFALHPPPLHAQLGTSRPTFSSPTAASLGRFGDVPVGLYTGQPDVRVPLFTAEGAGDLRLPVSLHYEPGGVRVDEIGGWVGMGWALEAGGTITRTVRGLPDDSDHGYYNTGNVFYDDANWPNPYSTNLTSLFQNIKDQTIDGEPDQFFFNFAGRAGQFVIGPTSTSSTLKEVRTIPFQKLRIVPTATGVGFTSWTVTTEDGTRYIFGAADTTHDQSGTVSPGSDYVPTPYTPQFVSSWHLTQIVAPTGETIRLYYTRYTASHQMANTTSRFDLVTQGGNSSSCMPSSFNHVNGHDITAQRLDSIKSSRHTLRFFADSLRADALSPLGARQEPMLTRVEVWTPGGSLLRRFYLNHDYFGGNRLRLQNVVEQDAAGNSLPPWSFEYDPQSFPARGSSSQDHWGYWNGKNNGGELVPGATTSDYFGHTVTLSGADRTPVASYLKVGSLTKITYPTGGTTAFTWEPNDYGMTRQGQPQEVRTTSDTALAASATSNPDPAARTKVTPFTVTGTGTAGYSVSVFIWCPNGSPCPWAELRDSTGAAIAHYTATASAGGQLQPGRYSVAAHTDYTGMSGTVSIQAVWGRTSNVYVGAKLGGGLRVAQVRTSDGHGTDQVHRYSYRLLSDTTRSSGVLPYEPVYGEAVHTSTCDYYARTASSNVPLGASGSIGYREVTVLNGDNGEFGRTRETFRNPIDNPDNAPAVPRPNLRITSDEWRAGQRLTTRETNAAGQLQQRTNTLYAFRGDDPTTLRRFRGMALSRFSYTVSSIDYAYNGFEVVSEWLYPSADSTFVYDETGASSVWTARSYTYGNPNHAQLTQLTETTSDGKQRITRMRYPADYPSVPIPSDPDGLSDGEAYAYALTIMKDSAHIHSPVIERWTSEVVGGTERVLQAELTTYIPYPTAAYRTMLPLFRLAFSAPGPVTDFTPASVQGTGLVWDESRYQIAEQINGYDNWGRPREIADANNAMSTFTYGGNANNAYLTQITRTPPGGGTGLTTQLTYDGAQNLASIRDEGGALRSFTYDGFGRLLQIRNGAGTPLRGFRYTYSRTVGNGWTYSSAAPNAVTDSTYLQTSPSVAAVVSTGYLDGLGRPIQAVAQDGANYQVAARQYDASGRAWRLWKPFTRAVPGFDANFSADATAYYNTDLGVTNANPYADSTFTPDALRRPKTIVPEYAGSSATAYTTLAYGVDAATGRLYTETTDEAGKKTRVYQDGFGNAVKTVFGYGSAEASTAQLEVNALGQRTQLTDPRGIVTTYTRDTRGLVLTRTNPDAGNRGQKYDRAGNLRYSQDANQATAGRVAFANYDFIGRPLVSGEGVATFSTLDPNTGSPPTLEASNTNWLTVRAYDAKPTTSTFPWNLFYTQAAGLTLSNTASRLAAVASKSNGAWQAEYYSYDAEGRLATRYTFTQANGGGSVLTAVNTTVTYTRDLRDAVTQRSVTVGSNTFNQWYDYDGRGLLARVYASTGATKPATADATYTYRPAGGVAQRQFQGGPAIPLRYTIREQLERIGDPASTAYAFSARYSYHPNGRLLEAEFYNAGSPSADKRYGWVFGTASWDALNRLKSADYSAWAGTGWTTTTAFDLTGIGYDAAGNLTALGRYRQDGTVVDNLGYGYGTTSNRLSSVTDWAGTSTETWDAETGSFTYDANGNLKTAPAPYNISAATYDDRNLPLSFTAGGVTSTYRYDAAGQRIVKQVGAGNLDAYVREGTATLGVFTLGTGGTPVSWHFNLLADDQVIGRHTSAGSRRYYHRDMLGSTRAVVEGGAVVESYDYDPWGILMPGRTLAGPTREGYNAKERDAETGLTYYGSRYYMDALGRWTTVDPPADETAGFSPYGYVDGNPLSNADPLGMKACPREAGGDGKTDEYSDCPEGTTGYYAYQAAQGRGGAMNTLKGLVASCSEQTSCKVVALFGAVYSSVLLVDAAWTWGAARLAPAAAGAGAAGAAAANGNVWNLPPVERGFEIEQQLGQNLPRAFPVIDRFTRGVATSIKSMDLSLPSYQSTSQVLSRLNAYVRVLSNFQGGRFDGAVVDGAQISQRVLQVAVPPGGMSPAQAQAFQMATQAAAARGNPVQIVTTVIR